MANIKSAEKRARQAVKRRAHNMTLRSKMRTAVKKVRAAVATGEKATAQAAFKTAVPVIDSMVNKGIIHRNTASRHKSRLSALIKALQ
ncbi:MAG: 30S ribosomal protein S20 [Steroidobacteraceae bacterium]|nr:30S ribosomal protein S20 [Steroidobacteraceae bacterium]